MPGLQSNSIPSPPPATLDASFSEVRTAKEVLKNSVVEEQASTRKISPQELKEHNTASEPWFVVNGEVYNGTAFLDDHPGGPDEIIGVAGEDATEAFMAIHPPEAMEQLQRFHIGTLVSSPALSSTLPIGSLAKLSLEPSPTTSLEPDPQFLHATKWKSAQLVSITIVNHDSRLYRFLLEHPEQPLGLPTGQHVHARLRRKVGAGSASAAGGASVEGELVQRSYTPISSSDAKGHLELLIKVYHRTKDFPEGGRMTLGFEELEVGDCVEFKGPLGRFQWLRKGMAKWRGVERRAKNIGMICGGSGITPIIQVLKGVIHDVEDSETKLWLLNANKTEADILLRSELESLATLFGPSRFQLHFCLSKASEDWEHSKGRIDQSMLQKHLPPPGEDSLILVCGPEPMIEGVVKPGLEALGWDVDKCLVVF